MNLLDLLFPKNCLECGKGGQYLCDGCVNKVLLVGRIGDNFSVFKYQGVIRKAIISLKYKFATDIADELSIITSKKLKNTDPFPKDTVLVPIPLHKQRENLRGFNQAELIGKKVASQLNWEFIPNLLIRNKNTIPQVGLRGLPRLQNIRGVFSINPKIALSTATNLVLFDDVYTTGSTIKESKKILTEAGFKDISSLTIAK